MIRSTMPKRKEKTLTELYHLTDKLARPEITPVLKGSCRIQGPVDELDQDLQKKSEASPTEKKNSKCHLHENIRMRVESGTCNVCATPCSSCLHFSRTVSVMESKTEDECSEAICKGKDSIRCSFSDSHSQPLFNSRACDERQITASETSNLLSVSSSHDSVSENAESKAPMRTFDTSDMSEDVEMHPKLPAGRNSGEDQIVARPQNIVAQSGSVSSNKPVPSDLRRNSCRQYEEQRGLECHEDNISCVTGVKDANTSADDLNVVSDRKDIACRSDSIERVETAVNTQTAAGCVANSSYEIVESTMIPSTSTGDAKDLEENSSSQLLGEPSPCSVERVESSLTGQVTTNETDGYKSAAVGSYNDLTDTADGNGIHARISSPMKIYPCLETENDLHCENPPPMSMKSSDINQQIEKPLSLREVSDVQEPSLLPQPVAGSESDVLEDDVKVCDICGDAGREELLAICSRCTDGAEHTYCMRIMLYKVPEGDWLCEGCKLNEEAEKRKAKKTETIEETEKRKAEKTETITAAAEAPLFNEEDRDNRGTFNHKLPTKLDTKIGETEAKSAAKSITGPQVSAKRHADIPEISPVSKKCASETGVRSPGALSPSKKPSLSRESSFKNMDGGKGKPGFHVPLSSSHSANNSQEVAHSIGTSNPNSSRTHAWLQSPRGNLSRSPTLNNSNIKPKLKHVMEDASQKQKVARESASSDARKEGSTRMINKSASFKNASSGAVDTKAKMQSVNPSHTEEPKSLKPVKEQFLERKSSFKYDRSTVSSSPKATASMSLLMSDLKRMSRDPKAAQVEVKSHLSSDQTVSVTTEGTENTVASDGYDEVKKQSHLPSSSVSTSSNGICHSEEKKLCQVGPKEEITASSSTATDKLSSKPEAPLRDSLPKSRESSNREGKSRHTVPDGSKSVRCHRCNEMGHIAQFCTGGNLRVSALKASAARSSKEMATKSNKWKDAIEAAILKNKDHKNNTSSDQSNGSSTLGANLSSEVALKEQLGNSTSDPSRATATFTVKQHEAPMTEAKCSFREADLNVIPIVSDEANLKPYMRKLPSQVSVPANPLRISSIPEHDYIWQGDFEICRSGRVPDFYEGIQAHLSTSASSKVRDVVHNFPCKVQLEEVPRVSSWPLQFHGGCAPEDSIALYFFAKDLESYERHYMKLLENMLKNDLALKGNVDGVELLVFPSNQLPVKSQCWNRLFYLWAVFRERRESCLGSLSGSQKNLYAANLVVEPMVQDLPASVIVPQKSSSDNVDCQLSARDKTPKVLQVAVQSSASVQLPSLSPHRSMNGSCPAEASPLESSSLVYHDLNMSAVDDGLPSKKQSSCLVETRPSTSVSILPSVLGNCSSAKTPLIDGYLSSEVKNTYPKQVVRNSVYGVDNELRPCNGTASVDSGLNKGKVVSISLDRKCTSDCEQARSTGSSLCQDSPKVLQGGSLSLAQEAAPESSRDRNKIRGQDIKRFMGEETSEGITVREIMKKEQGSWELTSRKRLYSGFSETVSEPTCEITKIPSQTFGWKEKMDQIAVDRENECKKLKECYSELTVRTSSQEQILGYGFPRRIFDAEPSFLNGQKGDCVCGDAMLPSNTGAPERYFFPVDTGPSREYQSGNSIPFHILSSDDEDAPETDIPNLELALGAEKKSPKKGNVPFFLDLIDDKSTKMKVLDPVKEDADDDASASLSLSLAFPFSDKDKTAKPIPKAENHVNTSLLLFGRRFTDS